MAELQKQPQLVICSVEFLASREVKDILLDCNLSSPETRPIICIDECQVLDEDYGWCGFREAYNSSTWRWLAAAFNPRFLLCSASMSEESLLRVCGTLGISRQEVTPYYKDPWRANVFQQVRRVSSFDTRFRHRNLGFLIQLAASGRKVQVFCPTKDLTWRTCTWLKECLMKAGIEDVNVEFVTGSSSHSGKEKA